MTCRSIDLRCAGALPAKIDRIAAHGARRTARQLAARAARLAARGSRRRAALVPAGAGYGRLPPLHRLTTPRPGPGDAQRCRCCEWSITSSSSDDIDETKDFYCDALGMREGFRPKLEFPGILALLRRHALHPHRGMANLRRLDPGSRHPDLDESGRHRARRPHRVQRERLRRDARAARRARLDARREPARRHRLAGNSSYMTRTASRSSSTFAILGSGATFDF